MTDKFWVVVAPTIKRARKARKALNLPEDTICVGKDVRLVEGFQAHPDRTIFIEPDYCGWSVMATLHDNFTRIRGLES